MMRALIWKDLNQNRAVIVSGAVLFLVPLIIAESINLLDDSPYPRDAYDLRVEAAMMCITGLGSASLALAGLGGASFAKERAERTAEFLGSLPVPRVLVVLSKLITTALLVALLWGIGLGLAALISPPMDPNNGAPRVFDFWMEARTPLWFISLAGLSILGTAWLLSSFTRSSVISGGVAIALTIKIAIFIYLLADRIPSEMPASRTDFAEKWITISLLTLGLGGLAFGTLISLRRRSLAAS